jgi:hypothetical protein
MTLRVAPQELRAYAAQLAAASAAAEGAKAYVDAHGEFSLHQRGAIGVLFPGHADYLDALDRMLAQLARLTDGCNQTLVRMAGDYERTDSDAAAELDATYPEHPRPPMNRDAADRNIPLPKTHY